MFVNTNEDNLSNLAMMLQSMQNSIGVISNAVPEIQQRIRLTQMAWSNGMQTHSHMLTQFQAFHIEELQKQMIILRKIAIQLDTQNGLSGRDVAQNYNVTPSRVSQVCSSPVSWQPVDMWLAHFIFMVKRANMKAPKKLMELTCSLV